MNYDTIIIGGGPAGLAFATDMASSGLKIAVIEQQSESQLSDPPYDGREIALTHLTHKIMKELDVWDLMGEEKVTLIKNAKVLNGTSDFALHFDHRETGKENLGFMVSNHIIRKAFYEKAKTFDNIELMCEREVTDVGVDETKSWVKLSDGTVLESSLLISADSRFSSTRRKMGISTSMNDFGRTCIVCAFEITGDHQQTAIEKFGYDRTLAILPRAGKEVSAVITLNSDESASIMEMDEDALAADIEERTNHELGKMKLISKRYAYPLVATLAQTFHSRRYAVIGDAAVGMHPVTAHGWNLGLRGAHTLATAIKEAMASGKDIADRQALATYSSRHRRAVMPMYYGTNALVKLYTTDTLHARFVRKALLTAGTYLGPAKKLIMDQLTELPDKRASL